MNRASREGDDQDRRRRYNAFCFSPLQPPAAIRLASGAKLGDHKQALVEAATTPEMRALLEAAE